MRAGCNKENREVRDAEKKGLHLWIRKLFVRGSQKTVKFVSKVRHRKKICKRVLGDPQMQIQHFTREL